MREEIKPPKWEVFYWRKMKEIDSKHLEGIVEVDRSEVKSAMNRWYSFNQTTDWIELDAKRHWDRDQSIWEQMVQVALNRWHSHEEYSNVADACEDLAQNYWKKAGEMEGWNF